MSLNDKLLKAAAAAGGITPSEHFGVVLYEGDGASSHSINGGKFGAAGYFNGSSSKFNTGIVLDSTTFSASVWFRTSVSGKCIIGNIDTSGPAVNDRDGFTLLTDNYSIYNNDAFVVNSASYNAGSLADGNWHHIVITNDGSNSKIYIDGSLDRTDNSSGWNSLYSQDIYLGFIQRSPVVNFFDGKIDQVRIFQKALSSSEVSTLYAETASTVESLDPLSEDTTDTLQVLGDSSCIATYRFENDEVDLSGNYDGTGTEIQYAAGRYGQAASFNGSASKVDIGSLGTTFQNNFSFSLWFNLDTIASSSIAALFSTFEDYYCYAFIRDSDKKVEVRVENASTGYVIKSTSTFGTYGVWHHLAVTKSSSDGLKIYINGSLENTDGTATVDLKTINGDNLIGAYNSGSLEQYYLDGKIDQVRIFNKAISASEVTTLYNENSLVASYRFEGNANDDTRNYDGTASNVSYEYGLGFTPDFVWIKSRSFARNHYWYDTTRGANKQLLSNAMDAEATITGRLSAFDTGGFTVGSSSEVNNSGETYVAWCLKANGGTTSSNTDGSITSTVQANQDAGFSIVTWTGDGNVSTVGHGLSQVPEMIIAKGRANLATYNRWTTYNHNLSANHLLYLDLTDGQGNAGANKYFADSSFSNTVFGVGDDIYGPNVNGTTMVAYCFHSVDGFSKFGSYTGNGSTNGPIVETGFEPAFLMILKEQI